MSGRLPSFLVWISTYGRMSPQLIYETVGSEPFLDAGIKLNVVATHRLKDDERSLSLGEAAKLYPAPAIKQAEDGK